MFGNRAWLVVVGRSNDALDGFGEDEVGDLVAGEERADESSAVGGNYANFLCRRMRSGHVREGCVEKTTHSGGSSEETLF